MTHSPLSTLTRAALGAALIAGTFVNTAPAASESGQFASLKRADLISQEDIRRAPGGYRMQVRGLGTVVIKEVAVPAQAGKQCMVHKRSLSKLALAALRDAEGPTTIVMNKVPIDESLGLGDHVCIGLGTGCPVVVSTEAAN